MPKYSAKQRKMRGQGKHSGPSFIQLFHHVKRSTSYHGLGPIARALLTEIIDRYNGCNNGMIVLGVREAAYEIGCSQGSVSSAMPAISMMPDLRGQPSSELGAGVRRPSGESCGSVAIRRAIFPATSGKSASHTLNFSCPSRRRCRSLRLKEPSDTVTGRTVTKTVTKTVTMSSARRAQKFSQESIGVT